MREKTPPISEKNITSINDDMDISFYLILAYSVSKELYLVQIICVKETIVQTNTVERVQFEQKLKQLRLRNTHVRTQIFDTLLNSNKPLSIQELTKLVQGAHFVSVYRSVDALQKADIIKLVPQGFKNLFELSDIFKPHHHHATCEKCGTTQEVRAHELEKLMKKLSIKAGLRPTRHHFELYGECLKCRGR